jgi:hypothetical protein
MPATSTDAALLKESRTEYINATVLDRKSGEAEGSAVVPPATAFKVSTIVPPKL